MKESRLLALVSLLVLAAAAAAYALTPISQAVMPYVISSPGSYVATENLTGSPGGPTAGIGIIIYADDVTLDMNGHALLGVPGTTSGIFVYTARQNVVIKNANIRSWGGDGINALSARNTQILNVRSASNGGYGIRVGQAAVVEQCGTFSNGLGGILVREGSMARNCSAAGNGGNGIEASNGCSVVENTSYNNRANGIRAGGGSRIVDNLCVSNGTTLVNQRAGILLGGSGSLVKNNHVAWSNRGIEVEAAGNNNFIVENTAANNADDYLITAGNISGVEVSVESNLQNAANSLINAAQ